MDTDPEKYRDFPASDQVYHKLIESSIGPIELVANPNALIQVRLGADRISTEERKVFKNRLLSQAEKELLDYLNGKLTVFTIPILLTGTAFQLAVWKQLTLIPYGETISYSAIAKHIGHSRASRAVGQANGRNRLPIIIPCHRVILSDGEIGGYSAGIEIKTHLINLENRRLNLCV